MSNLIYILPSEKGPAGGVKVTLQHAELINKIQKKFLSKIIFIKKKKTSKWKGSIDKFFDIKLDVKTSGWKLNQIAVDKKNKTKWFSKNVIFKNDLIFDKQKDFVILPEIFAHFAKELLIKNKINYAIFVQNGHAINFTNNLKDIDLAYSKAKFILSVSSHIDKCIKLAFPKYKNKIYKINQSIGNYQVNLNSKSNIITYMPRKLKDHSNLVLFFLKKYLPKKWTIIPLESMNEKVIFNHLKKSKIFLSFSNLEGFGLPPLEAGIMGNIVIGYTGQAGKEYWNKPIFKKIEHGDILSFVKEIKKTIKKKINYVSINTHRKKLLKKYSKTNQEKQIYKILAHINKYHK